MRDDVYGWDVVPPEEIVHVEDHPHGTNGVVNFIWKGRCSENISLRTKRCVYFTPNGAHYVPDPKPVLQKPGNFSRLSSVGLKMAWSRRKENSGTGTPPMTGVQV